MHVGQAFGKIVGMSLRFTWKSVLLIASALQGSYMLFDGIHKLLTGSYFGHHLGPWAKLVSLAGISPDAMAPVFVVLGVLWLMGSAALLLRTRWSRSMLIVLSVISLAYLVFGTLLSLISLVILLSRSRAMYDRQASTYPTSH